MKTRMVKSNEVIAVNSKGSGECINFNEPEHRVGITHETIPRMMYLLCLVFNKSVDVQEKVYSGVWYHNRYVR